MNPDTLRGHMDALLLSVLEHQPLHGYAIIEALQERSGGELNVPTGTVYPALRRLEQAGYLASEWATVGGRKRRTYRLTPGPREPGGRALRLARFAGVIGSVLEPRPGH